LVKLLKAGISPFAVRSLWSRSWVRKSWKCYLWTRRTYIEASPQIRYWSFKKLHHTTCCL